MVDEYLIKCGEMKCGETHRTRRHHRNFFSKIAVLTQCLGALTMGCSLAQSQAWYVREERQLLEDSILPSVRLTVPESSSLQKDCMHDLLARTGITRDDYSVYTWTTVLKEILHLADETGLWNATELKKMVLLSDLNPNDDNKNGNNDEDSELGSESGSTTVSESPSYIYSDGFERYLPPFHFLPMDLRNSFENHACRQVSQDSTVDENQPLLSYCNARYDEEQDVSNLPDNMMISLNLIPQQQKEEIAMELCQEMGIRREESKAVMIAYYEETFLLTKGIYSVQNEPQGILGHVEEWAGNVFNAETLISIIYFLSVFSLLGVVSVIFLLFLQRRRSRKLREEILSKYQDPLYWHPKCKNFRIIDWDVWDALRPAPPKVYDPPQFKWFEKHKYVCIPVWWSHRSPCCVPCCCMPSWLSRLCAPKTKISKLQNDDDAEELFEAFLNPKYTSDAVPDFLRGVWWMRDNIAPETLLALENWAWKSAPLGSGVLGVGTPLYNWTNDQTMWGWSFNRSHENSFKNVQIHPSGKWLALAVFRDPTDPNEKVSWNWIYVVQDDDVFERPDGSKLDYLKPGDLIRLSWNTEDVYSCDNDNLTYMYTPQRVAVMSVDEDGNGKTKKKKKLIKIQPAFEHLMRRTVISRKKNDGKKKSKQPICCGHLSCNMSPYERMEYVRDHLSNIQVWAQAPPPPPSSAVDCL